MAISETTTFEYDALNRLIKTLHPDNTSSRTEYDVAGNESTTVDAKQRRTEFDYDAYGRLIETRYPDSTFESKTYDAEGNLLTETDRLRRTTTYEYDKLNRLVKTIYPDNTETQTVYDDAGQVVAEIDERGKRTEHDYDLAGRRILTRDHLGNETHFDYDLDGNLVKQTDARGHVTQYEYNALDQRVKTVFHDGTFIAEKYDALGRVIEKTDQAGIATRYQYDALGRLTKVIDAHGGETAYTYDEAGNKLTQKDANFHTTRWEYDALGRVTARILPGGQRESMQYDEVGNLVSKTDFNGQATTYEYDLNDRLISTLYADGSTETFEYDAVGNRTKAVQTDPQGNSRTTTYVYDKRDRLIREEKPSGDVLEYEYDFAGNKTKLIKTVQTDSGPVTTTENYTYDDLNRLETATDAEGNASYTYDAVGNRQTLTYLNGNVTEYVYDSLNRLTELTISNGATTIFEQYRYTLHPTGRRTRIEELNGRVTNYQYDNLYRLTQETVTDSTNGNYSALYSYDAVGNRTQSIIDGVTTQYTYDLNDRLLQQGGERYTYDNNGNTLMKTIDSDVTTYRYNSRDQLIEVEATVGDITTTTKYTYDVDGIRTSKTEAGDTVRYLVDGNRDYAQVLAEVGNNAIQVQYLYGDDLIHQDRAGNLSYYLYDGLGSTRALSDGTGSLTDNYHYDAFGVELARTGNTPNDYLFTGEQFDAALQQYYLRARYYNQAIGRFTQMDTWQGHNFDPITLHKYLYANVDPANMIDPSGNFSLGSFSAASTISGVLTTVSIIDTGYSLFQIATGEEEVTAKSVGLTLLFTMLPGGSGLKLVKNFFKKCGNSFEEGTLVHTDRGLVPIESVKIGDMVLSWNAEISSNEYQEVVHLIRGEKEYDLVTLVIEDISIVSTPEHPFYVEDEWLLSKDIVEGSHIRNYLGGYDEVSYVDRFAREAKVYNLTISNFHNYYIGEKGLLVHNANFNCVKLPRYKVKNKNPSWPQMSNAADDWLVKGPHIKVGNVELLIDAGPGGDLVFKALGKVNPKDLAKAIREAENALKDKNFRTLLYNKAAQGYEAALNTTAKAANPKTGAIENVISALLRRL